MPPKITTEDSSSDEVNPAGVTDSVRNIGIDCLIEAKPCDGEVLPNKVQDDYIIDKVRGQEDCIITNKLNRADPSATPAGGAAGAGVETPTTADAAGVAGKKAKPPPLHGNWGDGKHRDKHDSTVPLADQKTHAVALPRTAVATPPRAGSYLSTLSAEAAAALPLAADAPGLASTLHRKKRRASCELPADWNETIVSQAREKLRIQNLEVCGLTSRKSDSSVLHELARRPSRAVSSGPARGRVVPKATTDLEVSLLAHAPHTPQHDAAPPHRVSSGLFSPLLQGLPFEECRQVAGGPGGHGAICPHDGAGSIWSPTTVPRPATQHAQLAPREEAATEGGSLEAAGSEPGRATRASDLMETASAAAPRIRRASRSTGDATTWMRAVAVGEEVAAPPPPPPPPPRRRNALPTEAASGKVPVAAPLQADAAPSSPNEVAV